MHTVETIRQSLLAPEKVEADLGMKPGDALVFDKSLLHEVEETLPGSGIIFDNSTRKSNFSRTIRW